MLCGSLSGCCRLCRSLVSGCCRLCGSLCQVVVCYVGLCQVVVGYVGLCVRLLYVMWVSVSLL